MERYHAARYPFIYCSTTEEDRFVREHRQVIPDHITFFRWDIVAGFQVMVNTNGDQKQWEWQPVAINGYEQYLATKDLSVVQVQIPTESENGRVTDPVAALIMIEVLPDETIIFMHDYHRFFNDITVVRAVLNIKNHLISHKKMISFLSASVSIPNELVNDIQLYDFLLPSASALGDIVNKVCTDSGAALPDDILSAIEALRGLTEESALNAVALSLAEKGYVDQDVLLNEKASKFKSTGLLTYVKPKETLDDVAGNQKAIEWLIKTATHPLAKAVANYGVPGAGKTLVGKVIANVLKRPCFFANINAIRGKWQGDAESRIKLMFDTANAMGRPFIILDEFDKSISGSEAGDLDSGVGQRIVQEFLIRWEEQPENGPFWYLTLNSLDDFSTISGGALIRRMDILFFVDLPTEDEAREIAKIWSRKYQVKIPEDYNLIGFSGADIAKLARNMVMLGCDVEKARSYLIPSGESIAEQIVQIRKKAKSLCMWASEKQEGYIEKLVDTKRKVTLGQRKSQ